MDQDLSREFAERRFESELRNEGHFSGVSWAAVVAGAFVAAAVYLILLALGAGLGLSSISPWSNRGLSPAAVGSAAIVWLILIEVISCALGGYLTGRLRVKWTLIHDDEVYFRDTANGFLVWAVALVATVSLLATAATGMVGAAPENTPQAAAIDGNAYFVDQLFRSDRPAQDNGLAARAEARRILDNALRQNAMPESDRLYLSRLIAARTEINTTEADRRISDVMTEARQAEDITRKLTARFLLWMFVNLLMGAWAASYAATIGGRQRDHIKPI